MTPSPTMHDAPPRRLDPRFRPWLVAGAALVAYLLFAGQFRFHFTPSPYTHHLILADAFLHGRLYAREETLRTVRERCRRALDADAAAIRAQLGRDLEWFEKAEIIRQQTDLDWTIVGRRYYGYWGPLTPALMMPVVALFGAEASDRAVNAVLGTANVLLFAGVLARVRRLGLLRLDGACQAGILASLAFSSVHFYMSCAGTVWVAAQVATLPFLLGAMLALLRERPSARGCAAAGALFGAAVLGRNVVAVMGLFFVMLIWLRWRGAAPATARALLARLAAFGAPCAAALGVQAWYNYARFGDALETGQAALIRGTGETHFVEDYNRYGQFHPHFLPRNSYYYIANFVPETAADGRWTFHPDGNSMFLVTPPLLLALLAWRQRGWFLAAVLAGVVPFVFALLCFRATGTVQFGNRYLLEGLPLLLLLAAAGCGGRFSHAAYGLLILGIAVNIFGAARFLESMEAPPPRWVATWGPFAVLAVGAAARLATARRAARARSGTG